MKKSLKIAALGLAAFGAVAGGAGVFAETSGGPYTDTIDVTISDSCVFSRGATAHVDGDGDTARGTWSSDLLSGTLAAGEIDADYGSSNFKVVCNHASGWKVTAAATALTGKTTDTENIPLGTPTADIAAWNYTTTTEDSDVTAAGASSDASKIVAQSTKTTPTAGRTFKVQYAVSVDHVLSAQTYEGTIAYTLAEL